MSSSEQFAANLVRLEQEAHRESFEEWHSAMSYKVFLLEKELGYMITPEMSGLAVMERLNMLDRYWEDKKAEYDKSQIESNDGKSNNKGLMK